MRNLIRGVILVSMVLAVNNCLAMANLEKKTLLGQTAPSFSLMDLNQNKVNSEDFIGKRPLILFFWATWCPHCLRAIKKLNEISPSLESKGAKIITIDLGESRPLIASYMKKNNYDLMVLLDEESGLVEPYGIVGVPTFFLIDKNGEVKSQVYSLPEDYEKILLKE